jgi:hypothetical protein
MISAVLPGKDGRCRKEERTAAMSKADGMPWPETSPIATQIFGSESVNRNR